MMRRAWRLGLRGAGRASPNPLVGCVIVDAAGRIIGEGWHAAYGGAHAEGAALADCARRGGDARGGTAYVTLEPCNHTGKTPPCAEALIQSRVRRVVIARADPHPVAKGGAQRLREAGVEVKFVEVPEAAGLSDSFVKRVETGLPWVLAKWAQTLDGKVATRKGTSKWISSAASRARVHRIRARVDAILTGMGTVTADNPALTARNVRRVVKRAKRVVVDPELELPVECELAFTASDVPTIVLTSQRAYERTDESRIKVLRTEGVQIEVCAAEVGPETFGAFLREGLRVLLAKHDVGSVLVEAGGGLVGELFREGLVDEALVYVAPRIFGDEEARSAVRGLESGGLERAVEMELVRVLRIGGDIELKYRVCRVLGKKPG